ncbi:MAG: FTR1 family protein, partial [Candidatus Binatia bacterium]
MIFTIFSVVAWIVTSAFGPAAFAREAAADPVESLRAAIAAYSPSDARRGKQSAADAFFLFEESDLDRQLGARHPTLYREVEAEWGGLLALMGEGAPAEEVRAKGERVLALLGDAERAAGADGSVFMDSFLIILREGFEAILILSALAAYLTRIGQQRQRPYLYGGAALAVVASVALWIAARSVLRVSGAGREALEGWTILLATAV